MGVELDPFAGDALLLHLDVLIDVVDGERGDLVVTFVLGGHQFVEGLDLSILVALELIDMAEEAESGNIEGDGVAGFHGLIEVAIEEETPQMHVFPVHRELFLGILLTYLDHLAITVIEGLLVVMTDGHHAFQ